jgi:hypothetical protein
MVSRGAVRGTAAALAAITFVGAILTVRRALRLPKVEETTATTATVVRTQVTPNGNRVDIRGAGLTATATVWTPREVYFIDGQTIPIVYDPQGNVSWVDPSTHGDATPYLLAFILCLGCFAGTAIVAFDVK